MKLLHVLDRASWTAARRNGAVEPAAGEDFVHCCTPEQLPGVLDRHFRGRDDLLGVVVDGAGLDVRWEEVDLPTGPERFPHVRPRIPVAAVEGPVPVGELTRFATSSDR